MRRLRILLSFFILLTIISSTAFAANNGIIKVSMNGGKVDVREVPIIMNGKAVALDVPSFIHIDRTLVPLRFVAENFGAKVDWVQKTKTATVNLNGKKINMTIDNSKVTIDKDTYTLDKNSIPKLVTFPGQKDARTMVPIAFISEILGFEVGYDTVNRVPFINSVELDGEKDDEEVVELDPDTNENVVETINNIITDISIGESSNTQKVIIKSQGKLSYDSIFLPDSNKLIIDIKDAKLDVSKTGNGNNSISVVDQNFNKVEYSQYSTNPNITRVMITLNEKLDYDIVPSKDGKTTVVSFVNKISGISLDYIDGKEVIVVKGSKDTEYNVMKLKNPERLVVDIMDSSFIEGEYYNYNYELGFVKGIRSSQFSGDSNYSPIDRMVRIVLDSKDGVFDSDVAVESKDGNLLIYPKKNFWDGITYDKSKSTIGIKLKDETHYNVVYDSSFKTMIIQIPEGYEELQSSIVQINDGLIEEIEVEKKLYDTIVRIKFNRSIEYEILSKSIDDVIELSFKRESNVKSTERLIVIDPGHGGKQPGASSPNGVKEKDVNLKIALKTEAALKNLGYNVLMTRSTDETVGLYDRPRMANGILADIFVSIHANSTTNRDVYGIEVLYSPSTTGTNKTVDQYPLAKMVMDEILKITGGKERGVIKRPDLVVVREANMPAILVEVGFLSNANEEKLITSDSYQNKLVEGIIRGIEKYFELY